MKISCPEHAKFTCQWPLGYLGRGYKLRGQHVDPFSHCSIWLCYTASDLALAHILRQNLNQVQHYKKMYPTMKT